MLKPSLVETESQPRTASEPVVTVLIPTYRDAHLLTKSLPVFRHYPPETVNVLVLNDDPSQDVPATIGTMADDPRVTVLEMGDEAWLARAINRGIQESTSEFVMFCNADLFPSATYVAEMLAFFEAHPTVGAATGKLLRFDLTANTPTETIDTVGVILTRNRRALARGEGERDTGQFEHPEEVFGVDGAALFARRSALETIAVDGQYFDESFVTQKEDVDLCWRLRLAGWECWYVPQAVAFHGRTTRGLAQKKYLSAISEFHRNEKEKRDEVRLHAMKNQWMMLIKNEDWYNVIRDSPFILGRELMVVAYNLVFSPKTLRAIPRVLRLGPETLKKRRVIKNRQTVTPRAMRRWLARSG
jgi:GT2 family glycosyltransferase